LIDAEPIAAMDDLSESIGEIYDAIGDADRWQRLNERLAESPELSSDIEHHLETARRAHEEHTRLIGDIETLANVLDQLALGALVVDGNGALLRANASAARLLADADGLMLVANRVRASDADDDTRLQSAIEQAATGDGNEHGFDMAFVGVGRRSREPLSVLALLSMAPGLRFFENRLPVTLLVVDPDLAVVPPRATLRALYGFTAREAEFAALLMRGSSVKDASVALGVSMATARTFLAQITAKTDSHSQAELMMRLLAIPRTRGNRT